MKRDKLLSGIFIGISVVLMIVSIAYLVTGEMIPGLIPICSCVLMVPMLMFYSKKENGKVYAILFLLAGILNLIAAVMQIAAAI